LSLITLKKKKNDNNQNKPKPDKAVIVIYDIFGWTPSNKNPFRICDIFAHNGYFTVMPDFFRSKPWPIEKMPIQNFGDEFGKFFSTVATIENVQKDVDKIVLPYLKKQGMKQISVFGLCWGGLMTIQLVCDPKAKEEYTSAVVIHAARLTPELIDKVQCPVAIMPASTDGPFNSLKEVLDKKPFGNQCFYKYYDKQAHGFMGTRGDWTDPKIKVDVDDALKNSVEFYNTF